MDGYLDMELLRFTTAGSVDDGKSTLIGRLLYDTKSLFDDQIEAVKGSSERRGLSEIDLSLFTDGLRDEREQGITIDVAYRFFATPKRKFIIADTPGHIQYVRNMVTGASTANLALILIDARKGMVEQTARHSYIASLLQIPHLVVCVNKMDLVGYDEQVFNKIVDAYQGFASKLDVQDIRFIPISALKGDNIVNRSSQMDWYDGATLLHTLENVHIGSDQNTLDARFAIQTVIRQVSEGTQSHRAYAGRIDGGIFRQGEEVVALPAGTPARIKEIWLGEKQLKEAFAPMSVSITLENDIEAGRGTMLAKPNNQPSNSSEFEAMMCWFHAEPLTMSASFLLRHTSNEVKAKITDIIYRLDIENLVQDKSTKHIAMNDLFRCRLKTSQALFFDAYRKNRNTGSFILIDPNTNETVAAGMII